MKTNAKAGITTFQFGTLDLGAAPEPPAEFARILLVAGNRLVDEYRGFDFTAPVDCQLDGLVGDGPAGDRDAPGEVLGLLGEEPGLAAMYPTQAMLVDEEVVAGGEGV